MYCKSLQLLTDKLWIVICFCFFFSLVYCSGYTCTIIAHNSFKFLGNDEYFCHSNLYKWNVFVICFDDKHCNYFDVVVVVVFLVRLDSVRLGFFRFVVTIIFWLSSQRLYLKFNVSCHDSYHEHPQFVFGDKQWPNGFFFALENCVIWCGLTIDPSLLNWITEQSALLYPIVNISHLLCVIYNNAKNENAHTQ